MGGTDTRDMVRAIRLLAGRAGRPLRFMEVCGTHTVAVFRHGIRGLLPDGISLLSGPGCPVCVTSAGDVEAAMAYAMAPGFVLATFGDMMRVPGRMASLNEARAEGAEVMVVYSPLDALEAARMRPGEKVVFFSTGFETTSPLVAATIIKAREEGIRNFFVHSVHKLVPPALRALLEDRPGGIDGFVLPGHVSAIIGARPYGFLSSDHGIPSVITGFDAADILEGILMLLEQVVSGAAAVGIQYRRVVREEGNPRAVELMNECFEPCDAEWRGIGRIPESGLRLGKGYRDFDVNRVMPLEKEHIPDPPGCSCGDVLKGVMLPTDCPLFGRSCRPERPVGPCMVSTEGSCAAYYRFGEQGAS